MVYIQVYPINIVSGLGVNIHIENTLGTHYLFKSARNICMTSIDGEGHLIISADSKHTHRG